MQQNHRAGSLKQTNKAHKSKHRSKREISAVVKGKTGIKEFTKRNRHILRKEERRNQSLQIRRNKRNEVYAKKRALGGSRNPPFLICVVALNKQLDTKSALSILSTCTEGIVLTESDNGVTHVALPNFKQRFSFVQPKTGDDFALLDALKIADTVLYISSALDEPVDQWGERALALTMAQGMPTPVIVTMDIESINPKKRTSEKQNVQKAISKWLPDEKVMVLDKSSDAVNIFRKIGNQKRKVIHHREKRPYLLAEKVEYCPDGEIGTLKVTGYLRGTPLSVNSLIHVSGLGDFQMRQIDGVDDPHPLLVGRENEKSDVMESEGIKITVLQSADPNKQESLQCENIPDPMDAEQTWPTDEEIKEAQLETKKRVRKVPKGMSDYQAAWIVESDAEEDNQSDDDDDENEESGKDNFMSCSESNSDGDRESIEDDFESVAESSVVPNDERYDKMIDDIEENETLERVKQAREDQLFPDEVDTPMDMPARQRFVKYRGLESFRTSPWDPKENLPEDYSRIFQFENYDRTRRRVFKEIDDDLNNMHGQYITIHIKDVPRDRWNGFKSVAGENPTLAVFGILPHEQKMSVVNVVLKRTGVSDEPIKSKERLIMQIGYRRFIVNPVFSQHTNGSKHKYERFFQPNTTCVATFYAPIQFSPSSVLCFKEKKNTNLQLVASGVLLSCNPDRLIIKRIILSGHPFKVNKRSAVIRFMFFNREDVLYYKPCKLRTKYGRTGHIREPLGTHGHMKCVFDGQLKSQDTVLLNLYKRIYPKWTYENCVVSTDDWSTKDGKMEE